MGFKRAKTIKLTWADDTEFAGLEVRARRVSIGKFLELGPTLEALGNLSNLDLKDLGPVRGMFLELGEALISWNLEDEETGEPVPCTPEMLLEQDIAFVNEVLSCWAEHIAGVPAPLEQPSPSGEPSLEASLPMEPLSQSLAS